MARLAAAARRALAAWDGVIADHERQTTPVDPAPSCPDEVEVR
jgi:hypothetical protein